MRCRRRPVRSMAHLAIRQHPRRMRVLARERRFLVAPKTHRSQKCRLHRPLAPLHRMARLAPRRRRMLPKRRRPPGTKLDLHAIPQRQLMRPRRNGNHRHQHIRSLLLRPHQLPVQVQLRLPGSPRNHRQRPRLHHAPVHRPEEPRPLKILRRHPKYRQRQNQNPHRIRTSFLSIAARFGTPASPISNANSVRSSSNTRSTPACPKHAIPYR